MYCKWHCSEYTKQIKVLYNIYQYHTYLCAAALWYCVLHPVYCGLSCVVLAALHLGRTFHTLCRPLSENIAKCAILVIFHCTVVYSINF